jgi:16S rRNA U516 pseudouridylate synthase RsuA-like enzyme
MVETLGARVLELVRVRIGGLDIGSLPIGTWRDLTPEEVHALVGEGAGAAAGRRTPMAGSR